ncbi:MAG TPA: AbgT family transporter [Bacteroidales bacterium]|nr:AbgT family transporter [Bacteroidales bacterium]
MKDFINAIKRFSSKVFFTSLDWIEKIGNKLPHPATLFFLLAVAVMLVSWVGSLFLLHAYHPVNGNIIEVNNLISADGFRWIYTNILSNFLNFPPLGFVIVGMIGIGLADGTGLFKVLIRSLVLNSPPKLVTGAVVAAGVFSSMAPEAGYVVLIPLSAMIFHGLGRHPLAGLAAAFCGVSGGFGANIFLGSIDMILAGITESAARMIIPGMVINPAVNYYFMVVSSFVVILVGVWVTERIVEPRLGEYLGTAERLPIDKPNTIEKKGLRLAALGLLVVLAILAISVIPEWGIFRNPDTGSILHSPFFQGIIIGILLMFFVPALIYGIVVGTIKSDKHVAKLIGQSMAGLSSYIVLVFFASQFIFLFGHSNLGIILAINGAQFLQHIGLTGITLIVAFVFFSGFLNLFMASSSAKWAIMAPVFVPMFMLVDPSYHPALTQVAFRIGDSLTNIITPMMCYFALILTFAQKYDEKYGIGTIISIMLPYSIVLGIFWICLLIIWMHLGIPLGPDGLIFMN